ncbi:MAG: SxtJ family membrane protein [Acidobacteriota bacterium]|nr:SxtJ family membrane protein [Acidobacteriota bacterium]
MSFQTHERYPEPAAAPSSDRFFGLTAAIALAFFGLIPLIRGGRVRPWCLAASAVFLVLSLAAPAALHPLNRAWTALGQLIARVTNPIVTGLMFFAVFTPAALILRMLGRDLLSLKFDPAAPTYWILRHPPGPQPETMRNEF